MYVLSAGCQWRAAPKDLPPRSRLYDDFDLWGWDGTLERIHEALYVKRREAAAREASPTAAIIPGWKSPGTSQSVKSAKKGRRIDPSGYDAGKKINGKKRHILVDTPGLLMRAIVHAADVQDRDGGALLMAALFGAFPFLTGLFADGGSQGPKFKHAIRRTLAAATVEIVKRSRTGSALTAKRSPSSFSPPSASCCENLAEPDRAPRPRTTALLEPDEIACFASRARLSR